MRRRGLVAAGAVIASLSMTVAACGASSNKDQTQSNNKTTSISVGWNQPFYSYNEDTSTGNNVINANIKYLTTGSFWYEDANSQLQTDKTFGTYQKISDNPLTVKYTIANGVKWSDGTPVDASDLLMYWAANSTNVNNVAADKVQTDKATGAAKPKGSQVYFDSAAGSPTQSLGLVKQVPQVSSDNKSITLVYTKPFADWQFDMAPTLPAHVVAEKALGISDPTKASAALVKAIQTKDTPALVKIADFWNTGFDFTSLPADKSLYLANGPYVLTGMKKDSYVTLSRNKYYNGQFKPKFDTMTVRFNPDPNSALQQLQNKEVALLDPQVTTDLVEAAKKVQGAKIHTGVEGSFEHMDLVQNNGGPFDPKSYGGDAKKALLVRQAFLHAMPRTEIVDKLIKPIVPDAVVRNSFVKTVGTPGYDEMTQANGSSAYANTNPTLAKQLLAQAGVKTPVKVRLMYDKTNPRRAAEFQIIQPAMKAAGFDIIDNGNANWSSKLGDGTYDAVFFAWQSTTTAVTQDALIYGTGAGENLVGYSNKQVDDLFTQLSTTTDTSAQLPIQEKIEKLMWADAIGIPVFQFPAAVISDSTRITNTDPGVLSPTMFYGFWKWAPAAK